MVNEQLIRRGIRGERVLDAFRKVEREKFVPEILKAQSYADSPLSIGENQTISQPYIVAHMIEALGLTGTERVLEIGTGSGYQTAILSLLSKEVYSVERIDILAQRALETLNKLNLKNIKISVGDGTRGLEEFSPFDAIVVSAAAPFAPEPLLEQLVEGGRMIIPLGERYSQVLTLFTKTKTGIKKDLLQSCVFVPLLGEYGWDVSEKD